MVSSNQREVRKPDMLIYRPGQGLQRRSKPEPLIKSEKQHSLEVTSQGHVGSSNYDDSTKINVANKSKRLKSRRPDIQIYIPKAKLYASCINQKSNSSEGSCMTLREDDILLENSLTCNVSKHLSSLEVKTGVVEKDPSLEVFNSTSLPSKKSWADQVEEQLETDESYGSFADVVKSEQENTYVPIVNKSRTSDSPSGYEAFSFVKQEQDNHSGKSGLRRPSKKSWADQVEEQLCTDFESSSDKEKLDQEYNLVLDVDEQKTCNLSLSCEASSFVKQQPNNHHGKCDPSCDSEKVVHPFTGELVPIGSDLYNKLKAREDIIDQQIAIFDSWALKSSSRKKNTSSKNAQSSAVSTSNISDSSSSNSSSDIPVGDKQKVKVDKQGQQARFRTQRKDKPSVIESPVPPACTVKNNNFLQSKERRESFVDQQTVLFDEVVNIKSYPETSNVVSVPFRNDNCYNSSFTTSYEQDISSSKESYWNCVPGSISNFEIKKCLPALAIPFPVPCTKVDHTFCETRNCESYYSTLLDASSYIPPPRARDPLYIPPSQPVAENYTFWREPSNNYLAFG